MGLARGAAGVVAVMAVAVTVALAAAALGPAPAREPRPRQPPVAATMLSHQAHEACRRYLTLLGERSDRLLTDFEPPARPSKIWQWLGRYPGDRAVFAASDALVNETTEGRSLNHIAGAALALASACERGGHRRPTVMAG